MPSIIPGYEYDIFISYRQKDNRYDGWVTEFVARLRKELEATIKEDITIYFDENPHDGILETHDVDRSLSSKIKSLVLIPVLSQTYCDESSFAWQNEFQPFNKMANEDTFGRDIRLRNGNVASRVLPVSIHDLDPEDRDLIENELKTKIRSIDFIFRSPGVNRPLRQDDKREDNLNRLLYRDQINKVANAIKEILQGIKYPDRASEMSYQMPDKKVTDYQKNQEVNGSLKNVSDEKSIAVLPFVSLTHDASQDYFADGITENILIQLASLRHLKVISRTSVMRYKKSTKSAPEIAGELGVKYILEGSAQSHGNKVRIQVQLIDALSDNYLWGKVFVENLDDIFSIQTSVAEVVAKELNASLHPGEDNKIREIPTKNLEAYDLFLKGRHAFNRWNVEGYRTAEEFFKRALEKDPDFTMAYSYLASTYSALMSWNGDLSPEESLEKINLYLTEAWNRGATDNDYLTKAFVEFFIVKDFSASEGWLQKAMEIGPNNATVLYTYSYLLNMMGRSEEALKFIDRAKVIDPISVSVFNYQGITFYLMQRYEEAIAVFKEALQLYPQALREYDHLGRVYLTMGKFQEAIDTINTGLRSSAIRPPSMVAYLTGAHHGLDNNDEVSKLLDELLIRSQKREKGVNLYIAHVYNFLGDSAAALHWLNNAKASNDVDLIYLNVDPLLKNLREFTLLRGRPDYEGAEKFITDKLEKELPSNLYYHNMDHIRDVLQSALAIAEREGINDEDTYLLRIAALYHDSGFIVSPKNHEETGCKFAEEFLPQFGLNKDQICVICGMIRATKIPQSPKTLLEKILCDADLDYLGRDDFYDIGSRLLEEMKLQGLVETEREWNLIQKTFIESHRYHTKYGQDNRETYKQQHRQEIVAKLQR